MKLKIIGYIGVIIIGVGFIMMAASKVVHNGIFQVLQAVLGIVFIIIASSRIISEYRKDN